MDFDKLEAREITPPMKPDTDYQKNFFSDYIDEGKSPFSCFFHIK
jgi:hypothetical protein